MRYLITAVLAITLFSCTKQVSDELATRKAKGHITLAEVSAMTLTNNGDGTFSIYYGGATNITWVFFRTGDELAANGNVVPLNSQSCYNNPVTIINSRISGTYYQAVVVTGDPTVVNGWTETYTNVVQ